MVVTHFLTHSTNYSRIRFMKRESELKTEDENTTPCTG
jgi:hypothetical protein